MLAPPVNRLDHRARRACPASGSAPRSGSRSTSCASRPRRRSPLAEAIREVKETVGLCEVCFNLAVEPRCRICEDERRDADAICVVEEPSDVIPIERTNEFNGRYHVLGGALSPIDGIDPEDLQIAEARRPRRARRHARGGGGHELHHHRRGHRALHRRHAARARARGDGHAAGERPAGRRRPRVRRRGHARQGVPRPPRRS